MLVKHVFLCRGVGLMLPVVLLFLFRPGRDEGVEAEGEDGVRGPLRQGQHVRRQGGRGGLQREQPPVLLRRQGMHARVCQFLRFFYFPDKRTPRAFSQSWRRPGRHAEGIHSQFGGYSILQNSCETAVLCCIHTSNIFFNLCSFSLGDNPPVCRVRHGFCERRFALVSHG